MQHHRNFQSDFNHSTHKSHFGVEKTQNAHLITSDLWKIITGDDYNPHCSYEYSNQKTHSPLYVQTRNYNSSNDYSPVYRSRTFEVCRNNNSINFGNHEQIFNQYFPKIQEYTFDGNYYHYIQKIIEYYQPSSNDPKYHKKILDFLLQDLFNVVNDQFGYRVLQKFIECTSVENVDAIFNKVKPDFIELCFSQNGNHIAQRLITILSNRIPEIIDIVKDEVNRLALDSWGCRVIQKLFEILDIDVLEPLVDKVLNDASNLSTNQFGNYVVQSIVKKKPEHIDTLIEKFSDQFYKFSIHKNASNVVEQCINHANFTQLNIIIDKIIGTLSEGFNEDNIRNMAADNFGNYVLQRIIEKGTYTQNEAIRNILSDYQDFGNTKHVMNCLKNVLQRRQF